MKYWVDLHVHSCLSPCADEDMTPNNIVNMALLKGLDFIAITDHNSMKNIPSILEVAKKTDLTVVPGVELCTSEEIHLVCLFPDIDKALRFEEIIYENLAPIKNREEIFGGQIIMDGLDNEIGREEILLVSACNLDIGSAISLVRQLDGVIIPAHIDRESFSMVNTLGTVPSEYGLNYLECSKNCNVEEFLLEHPELKEYKIIKSSDAHFLGDILEKEMHLDLSEKSIEALLHSLRTR